MSITAYIVKPDPSISTPHNGAAEGKGKEKGRKKACAATTTTTLRKKKRDSRRMK